MIGVAGGRSVQRGHITRDIAFSKDGRRMFVSVGSASNDEEGMGKRDAAAIARWEAEHGLGSAWGNETDRAVVLVFDPDGRNRRVSASGLRNCVGLAVHPLTGDLWCSTNERDDLGDDLVPDFITRQKQPQISSIFKADTARLHVSREKDGKLRLGYAGMGRYEGRSAGRLRASSQGVEGGTYPLAGGVMTPPEKLGPPS